MPKKILFLSGIDFKEKSIQVIRKTPEAYVNNGWQVDYVVYRDNSPFGNYFYEKEINPNYINIERYYWPLSKLQGNKSPLIQLLFKKIASIIVSFKLSIKCFKKIKHNNYDVIYGYEINGVNAIGILQTLKLLPKEVVTVSRFQGTFLYDKIKSRKYLKLIGSFDHIIALRTRADLTIMTDDGTRGDLAYNRIANSKNNFHFWPNGVDIPKLDYPLIEKLKEKIKPNNEIVFCSVSRLVDWKRVDRVLRIISKVKESTTVPIKCIIIGGGNKYDELVNLREELKLNEVVEFIGPIQHNLVQNYLHISDFFISMYDGSNVGNPLLEAIRFNKIIVTLNNGDTGKWISHKENGLIYSIDNNLINNISLDILNLINDISSRERIISKVKILEKNKLWTWEERLQSEISEVEKICLKNHWFVDK